jgi:hypothetical protein
MAMMMMMIHTVTVIITIVTVSIDFPFDRITAIMPHYIFNVQIVEVAMRLGHELLGTEFKLTLDGFHNATPVSTAIH